MNYDQNGFYQHYQQQYQPYQQQNQPYQQHYQQQYLNNQFYQQLYQPNSQQIQYQPEQAFISQPQTISNHEQYQIHTESTPSTPASLANGIKLTCSN